MVMPLYLYVTLYLARAQATGANIHGLSGTIHDDAHFLRVGCPVSTGFMVGVANVVARHGALFADLTNLSHLKDLLTGITNHLA